MSYPFATSAALALLLTLGLAAPSRADIEADCRAMAQEDEVPAEDLEDYIAECVAAADTEMPEEGEDEPADRPSERR
jgi:hypothetical protein